MLSKLFKYEIKDTVRSFSILFAVIFLLGIVSTIAHFSKISVFNVTSSVLLIVASVALPVVTLVMIIIRYYKNMFGNEGYLMFTLPVKSQQLLISKAVTSVVWTILAGITAVAAFLLGLYYMGVVDYSVLKEIWGEIERNNLDKFILGLIPILLLSTMWLICQIFFSITLSNVRPFSNMGAAGAFVIFIVVYIACSILNSIFAILAPISITISDMGVKFGTTNMVSYMIDSFKGTMTNQVVVGLGGYIFVIIMVCVGFYLNGRLLNRKISIR